MKITCYSCVTHVLSVVLMYALFHLSYIRGLTVPLEKTDLLEKMETM